MKCILFLLAMLTLMPMTVQAREKVLLDTDMVEMFDDGVALIMLAMSPSVELLGVTTASGNTWAEEGTAFAVRQLELAGRTEIPVALGVNVPLRPQRAELLESERKACGMGEDTWIGCFGSEKPESWQTVYQSRYGKAPSMQISEKHAVDVIIDTVRANPGEVTIAAIGPCTNLALAVRKAPDIAPLIKRVLYMGGAFFQPGNVTPAAEFNWWFDPEAARITVRSPFQEQVVFGLDVCEKIVFQHDNYERFLKTLGNTPYAALLRSTFDGENFAQKKDHTRFIWDVLVAAVIIDPSLITREVSQFIDVNDTLSLSYGQSLAYPKQGPEGSQKARIVLEVDQKRFEYMLNDPQYWKSVDPLGKK